MKHIPPSDFCRWAYPDVVPKSSRHKYLAIIKNQKETEILCWSKHNERFHIENSTYDYTFEQIELIMILPNDPSENDTKEP